MLPFMFRACIRTSLVSNFDLVLLLYRLLVLPNNRVRTGRGLSAGRFLKGGVVRRGLSRLIFIRAGTAGLQG